MKNPYGNSSRRGRGWMLITTVVVLMIACGAWITSYTYAVGSAATEDRNVESIDPSTMGTPVSNSSNLNIKSSK